MKKWKVLSLLTLVMAVPLGITACNSSEFWKTPEVQTERTVDNSEDDATVQEDTEDEQSEDQNTEAEDAISEVELEEALKASDTSGSQVDHVHQYVTQVLKEATCTEDGRMVTSCTSCGYARESVIAAIGHEAGEWKVTQLPGRLTEGTRVLSCVKCGEVMGAKQSSLPELPMILLIKRAKAIPIVIPLALQKMRPAQRPVRKYTTVPVELLMWRQLLQRDMIFPKQK